MLALNEDQQQMWDVLKKKKISDHLQESLELGEPTKGLLNSFVDIANRSLNKPQFKYYTYRDEMVNDAVLLMLQHWKKAAVGIANNTVFAYFHQIAVGAALQHIQRENRQRGIRESLTELKLG